MFADWLIDKVYLVEIRAPSDDDAYAIFETMNKPAVSRSRPRICLRAIF